MDLESSVENLKMVGAAFARRLNKLNIFTIEDLLYHFPFRYEDYSRISEIEKLQPENTYTIKGKVIKFENIFTRHGKKIQVATIADKTGEIKAIWFNQIFLSRVFRKGENVSLAGRIGLWAEKLAFVSPEYEILKNENHVTVHTGRLSPVYSETTGISSKWLRSRIFPVIERDIIVFEEFIPQKILKQYNLPELYEALRAIHFPNNISDAQLAHDRFAFEELFLTQLAAIIRKMSRQNTANAPILKIDKKDAASFINSFPFRLTNAQIRCIDEIFRDLESKIPMNRLLQGDVGSGKTAVAAGAIFAALKNGYQSAIMAPTEILANQHFETLKSILSPSSVKIALITGSSKKIIQDFDVAIGTHALLHKKAKFSKLGLVVIDEQHRFGVKQRASLLSKGKSPHLLTMTATPIPRTIALTIYRDLDMSIIDEMPLGRKKIKTWVIPEQKRKDAYAWIKTQIAETKKGCFLVCPFIEESETLDTVKAAKAEFEKLKNDYFLGLNVGLLHGKLPNKEKDRIIGEFRNGNIDILVATPVVEVGIDIPTATIMVIEGANHFGLAQLHQLRGRVGRSGSESYCLLFSDSNAPQAIERLKNLEKLDSGLKLAEVDFKLRGPGEVFGIRQHGIPSLKIADLNDLPLIEKASKSAEMVINASENLSGFPLLRKKLKKYTISASEAN